MNIFKKSLIIMVALHCLAQPSLASEGGMNGALPQLELDHYSSQIFWLLLTFGLLYLLISKNALPVIHEVVEKRRHRIERDLQQAEKLASEAAASKASYEKLHQEALSKANELLAKINMEIEAKTNVENGKLDAEILRIMQKAEVDISSKKLQLQQKLSSLSQELAQMLLIEIAGKQISDADLTRIINDEK